MKVYDVSISDIVIPERIREQMDTDGSSADSSERSLAALAESIKKFGLLNPITITQDNVLVAGRRRLQAHVMLNRPVVPAHFLDDTTYTDLIAIEAEENIRRLDMPWPDRVKAIRKYHNAMKEINPAWGLGLTAEALNLSHSTVARSVQLANELEANPNLSRSPTFTSAYTHVTNKFDRVLDAEMAELIKGEVRTTPPEDRTIYQNFTIRHDDFLKWAYIYTGPLFNFLHCDFPYGINIQDSKILHAGSHIHSEYEDSFLTYSNLLSALLDNLDTLLAPQAHVMFWFSMKHYQWTIDRLESRNRFVVNRLPLIWMKSDGAGITPDVTRGPRQIYETALLATRGDRKVVRPLANAYSSPSVSGIHSSIKPEPMLKHFFGMFVDDTTRTLDPTCGSGSSIRAAQSCGGRSAVGLELDADFADRANNELTLALRKAVLAKSKT